jgi:regulator of nucleoside diphosphate kinase
MRADEAALRRPRLLLSRGDHERLQLIAMGGLLKDPRLAGSLLEEIDRAEILADDGPASDHVGLGSSVEFRDLERPGTHKVRIVEKACADDDVELSVLSPLGVALIGLGVGARIVASDRRGSEWVLRVVGVTAPRQAGATAC